MKKNMDSSVFRGEAKDTWQPSVDINEYPWMHVYAQHAWHDEAIIEGTRAALTNLRDAINRALHGDTNTDAEAIVADGEGYIIEINIRSYEYLRGERLPYTADFIKATRQKRTSPQTVDRNRPRKKNTDTSKNNTGGTSDGGRDNG